MDSPPAPNGWSALLAVLRQGALVADARGRIREVNDAACRILRRSRANLLACGFDDPGWEVLGPDGARLAPGDFPVFAARCADPSAPPPVVRLSWEDGTVQWLEVVAGALPGGHVAFTFEDVTARERAERRLRESEERASVITDAVLDAILIMDPEGCISYWNPAATRIFGFSAEEAVGRNLHELIVPERYLEEHRAGFEAFRRTGQGVALGATFELEARHKEGHEIQVEVSIAALKLELHGAWHTVGVVRDIGRRKEAEAALTRAERDLRAMAGALEQRVQERTAQLEATNRELEAFSYSVSHDLRGPLRGIDGFSQILMEDYRDRLDDTGRHYLARIRAGAARMGELMEGILKLSRLNRSDLDPEPLDLSACCAKVADDLARADPGRRVAFSIQPGMAVRADRQMLTVLLENLLGNAWKFTSRCPLAKIEAGAAVSPEGERVFFVRDNGAGFDPEYAAKLFHAFQRLHSADDFPGTGIGLAIVQRIVQRHGGRVWAESEGGGATFSFTLPG